MPNVGAGEGRIAATAPSATAPAAKPPIADPNTVFNMICPPGRLRFLRLLRPLLTE
jgi:hypothetical protein